MDVLKFLAILVWSPGSGKCTIENEKSFQLLKAVIARDKEFIVYCFSFSKYFNNFCFELYLQMNNNVFMGDSDVTIAGSFNNFPVLHLLFLVL